MLFLYIFILAVMILLSIAIAIEFQNIASMKGHDSRRYFWWTFFFLPIGALMVIALPNINPAGKPGAKAVPDTYVPKVTNALGPTVKIADPSKPTASVAPVLLAEEDSIVCPACGCKQKAGRTVCWNCGAKFEK